MAWFCLSVVSSIYVRLIPIPAADESPTLPKVLDGTLIVFYIIASIVCGIRWQIALWSGR
jgi:hypothetical protein